jgi:hypothetical protein
MCNPNSSIARRRPVVALPPGMQAAVSKSSSIITKNILGSMFRNHTAVTVQPRTGTTSEYTVPATSSYKFSNNSSYQPSLYSPAVPRPYYQEEPAKPKPKRRRKPQKPGKTAKLNDRHFVVHNYHDHAADEDHETDDDQQEEEQGQRRKGGVAISFPLKLHAVLDQVEADGLAHIISWRPHGRCFLIHKPKEFVDNVMPNYFRQTKLTSFQRQLNLYGFNRLTRGTDSGGYYHELFLRSKTFLCKQMTRTKVKGTKFKAASSPEQEPNFYKMVGTFSISILTLWCYPYLLGANIFFLPSFVHQDLVRVTPSNSDYESHSDEETPAHNGYVHYESRVHETVQPQEPLPYQYQRPVVQQVHSLTSPLVDFPARAPYMFPQDQILDEAVDELFLSQPENEQIMDFVNVWDPASFGGDGALTNDAQLGNILDKLLEE